MEDWNLDFINTYFASVHNGKVVCKVIEGKGRVLVANQTFQQGAVIFEEAPLHIVTEAETNDAYKIIKRMCRKDPATFYQDPLWYWAAVCSLRKEDIGTGTKSHCIPTVSADTQKKILCLYHEPVDEASSEAEGLVRELHLSAPALLVDELLRAWILNCFDHSEDPQGYASYFGASFMSHSCHPNAVWHFAEGTQKEDTFVLHARRDIEVGDEICISYLPEQGLLHSAAARRTELRSSKSFLCTCERCGPSAVESDLCRGFRCPFCTRCALFHPGPLNGSSLSSASCGQCSAAVGDEARRLLKAEEDLANRLKLLDEQVEKRSVSKVLKEHDVQYMLRLVGDSASGSVGPQHWLCDRLWAHLADWYDDTGRPEDACRMFRLRVEYQRQCYKSLHGELAWTLEAQADVLLRQAGLMPGSQRLPGLDDAAVKRLAEHASKLFEEGVQVLRLMFGSTHSYFKSLERKQDRLSEYLATGTWPTGKGKRKRGE